MQRRPKRTKQSHSVNVVKQSTLSGVAAIDGRYLAWRFSNNDKGGPFSWVTLSDADWYSVRERLGEFEKMNVSELARTGSHHRIPQAQLTKKARERLQVLELDDLDELWSFRVTGERRFWCIKHENIYALLWWDPHHQVYLVPKKNT